MKQVSSRSSRDPEGSINFGLNLWHEVVDRAFFDVILLVMFDPKIPSQKKHMLDNLIIELVGP